MISRRATAIALRTIPEKSDLVDDHPDRTAAIYLRIVDPKIGGKRTARRTPVDLTLCRVSLPVCSLPSPMT